MRKNLVNLCAFVSWWQSFHYLNDIQIYISKRIKLTRLGQLSHNLNYKNSLTHLGKFHYNSTFYPQKTHIIIKKIPDQKGGLAFQDKSVGNQQE